MLRHLNRGAQPSVPTKTPSKPSGLNGMNPMQMISEFAKFKKAMAGKDPKAVLNQLLASGQMTQEQLNQLKETAQSLMSLFKG